MDLQGVRRIQEGTHNDVCGALIERDTAKVGNKICLPSSPLLLGKVDGKEGYEMEYKVQKA
jgi:hypothetical protein